MIPQICNGSAAHRGTLFSGCRGAARDACTHTSIWYSPMSSNRWSKYEWKCRRSRAQIGTASPRKQMPGLLLHADWHADVEGAGVINFNWTSRASWGFLPSSTEWKAVTLVTDNNKSSVLILRGFDLKANKWTWIKKKKNLRKFTQLHLIILAADPNRRLLKGRVLSWYAVFR